MRAWRIGFGLALVAAFACTPTPADGPADAGSASDPGTSSLFAEDRVAALRIELGADDWAAMLADPEAEVWFPGAVEYDDARLEQVQVRVKGNSSLRSVAAMGSHRFSFKVDLNDTLEDQELLGQSKLVLNNGFKDPTLLREALAYGVARAAGLPASRTGFVDLWVGDEHLGLYTLVEDVGGRFLDERFQDGDGILYQPEPPAGELRYRGDSIEDYPGLEVERHEELGHAAYVALVAALQVGDVVALAGHLDVELALRYLSVNALLANLDSYLGTAHNYYLYGEDQRFTVIPWDMNEAFGVFTCGCDRAGLIALPIEEPTCAPAEARPLVTTLLAEAELAARYRELIGELLDGPFAEDAMAARVDALAAVVRPVVAADTSKFFTTEQFEQGMESDVPGGGIGLMSFVRERRAAVAAQLDGSAPADAAGQGGCRGGGAANPCGDGVCDQAEQNNPGLCPQDC
ncbi:MAG: CotH kinase family protein [Deltaproteobacteria bacterium]|nr:CotH kinase family protein [Deltaproteobacteria bacterium]